jgi:hypothetical protein
MTTERWSTMARPRSGRELPTAAAAGRDPHPVAHWPVWLAALALAGGLGLATPAVAAPDGPGRGDGRERGDRYDRHDRGRPDPGHPGARPARGAPEWHDRSHGHDRRYPSPGVVLHAPPPHAHVVPWRGVSYRFHDGVWYSPYARGYRVVRPAPGLWVPALPLFRTVVVVGGLSYLYLNGSYYRERPTGGYEVVADPPEAPASAPTSDRLFVYPTRGQSPQLQASDEFDCHRWAAHQTGFDPSAQAAGSAPPSGAAQRDDYRRAQTACLEARGYSVR